MGMRNYCAGYFNEDTGKLEFYIQAEKEVGIKGTKGYLVAVPKLVFGKVGTKLHAKSPLEYLAELTRPTVDSNMPPPLPHPPSQQPRFPEPQFSLPPQQQQRVGVRPPLPNFGSVGGFIRPLQCWKGNRQQ